MIVTRAPFRVSLFGGGTDFKEYFNNNKARILSFTINKYIYVVVKKRFDNKYYINYSKKEICNDKKKIKHELIREVLKYFKINFGLEISIISDIPSKGSGLGSSSALTNALILAISKIINMKLSQKRIAQIAVDIELNKLKKPIGIQDQYGTAIGNLKIITMYKNSVSIKKIQNKNLINLIQRYSIIYDTRKNRKAEEILKNQKKNISKNFKNLNAINTITNTFINNLDQLKLNSFIKQLNESWSHKKKLEKKISNSTIDLKINYLKKLGFKAFKLCGAGKGGFIYAVRNKLTEQHNVSNIYSIKLDTEGVKVLYILK